MKFGKLNLQRTKKIGAMLAVEIWMQYPPETLPEYWREAMVERGVGERKPDGTIRLTRRGRRLRAELLAQRAEGADRRRIDVRRRALPQATGISMGRSWRDILARCSVGSLGPRREA